MLHRTDRAERTGTAGRRAPHQGPPERSVPAGPPVRSRPPRLLVAAALVVAALAALPLVWLLVRVAGADPDRVLALLVRSRTVTLAVNSALLVTFVSAGCLVLGLLTATLLARVRLPRPGLWWVLAALPLAVPSYLLAFAVLAVRPESRGLVPLVAVLVLACTPYVTLPAAAALRAADTGPEDAARTLGRGPVAAFCRVTLPQALPAAFAGTLLAALYTLSDFGAPALLRYESFTWAVQAAYEGTIDRTGAAVTALVLAALTLLLVVAERTARRRWTRAGATTAVHRIPPARLGRGGTAFAVTGLGAVAAVTLLGPPVVLVGRIVAAGGVSVDWARLASAAWSTLLLAGSAAVLAVVMALPVGMLAARYRGRLVAAVESTAYLGQGLPGVVVGLSLVFFSLAVVPGLYQTAAVLVFGYAVLYLPKAVGATRASVERVPVEAEEVARTLGRSGPATWWAVTARQAWPGVAAGGLLVMVTAMKELPATLMLRPTGVDTLATQLWAQTSLGAYGAAAPAALALLLLACVPAALLVRAGTERPGDSSRRPGAADRRRSDDRVPMTGDR
ncbi:MULTISPECIES: ABC transporter permease [Pseudonocardia]|uniref:ABC transporter permease n=1 Tax=Pseudonocardia saturnea TaxID=33909 RepID=A0ABQ0RRA8_9PSEU|nr:MULTISPECIES: ABC transporter permease subunit [Pseudonocardia]BBG02454.1 ABC transporter permease [Pseudonocardia autotrophica]GEC23210.1 ABC transporter permease [Pseudonocardia saturnea]